MPNDFVVPASSLLSAEQALAMSLRASNALSGNKSLMKQIFFSWSNLHDVTLRLASLLSSAHPGQASDDDLLANCISAAARAYADAQIDTRNDFMPAAAYLQALMAHASLGLAQYDVFGVRGPTSGRWELAFENLTAFAGRWDELRFVGQPFDEDLVNGTHIVLTSRLLNVNDATLLSRMYRTFTSDDDKTLERHTKALFISLRASAMMTNCYA